MISEGPIALFDLELSAPLEPVQLPAAYTDAVALVRWRGEVLGQISLRAEELKSPEGQLAAVESSLGPAVRRRLLEVAVERALRGTEVAAPTTEQPRVTVIVDASRSRDSLATCVAALRRLRAAPAEILVAGPEADSRLGELCAELGLARWQAEGAAGRVAPDCDLVAMTDAACTVDPGWLDDLGRSFSDPLVMAVAGYVAASELETPAQVAYEAARGFDRSARRVVLDGASESFDLGFVRPAAAAAEVGSGVNLIVRREVLEQYGLDVGGRAAIPAPSTHELETFLGLLSAGYRIVIDPSRLVRCAYPRSMRDLTRAVRDASAQSAAFAVSRAMCSRRLDGLHAAGSVPFRFGARAGGGRSIARLKLARGGGVVSGLWRRPKPQLALTVRSRSRHQAEGGTPPTPGTEPAPEIAVCICSFARREKLVRLLHALASQDHPADRFEVVVVIDGSSDGSAAAARAMSTPYHLRVIEQPHRGLAAARNTCAMGAQAPLLLYLDDDMHPEPDLVGEHVRAHAGGELELVALGYCPTSESAPGLFAKVSRGRWEDHFRRKAEADHPWSWFDFSAGNSSIRRELLDKVGGFDEDFARRNEEQELGVRLAEQGVSFVYLPAARAWHDFDARLDEGLAHTRRQAYYDVLLVAKHRQLIDRVNLRRWALDGRLRPKARAVYRLSACGSLALSLGAGIAARLERFGRRRSWWRLARQLMVVAYVLGMRDALPTESSLNRFLRHTGGAKAPTIIPIELGSASRVTIPEAGGEVDLEICCDGRVLAHVAAQRPGLEWNWRDLIERATAAVAGALGPIPIAQARNVAAGGSDAEAAVEDA